MNRNDRIVIEDSATCRSLNRYYLHEKEENTKEWGSQIIVQQYIYIYVQQVERQTNLSPLKIFLMDMKSLAHQRKM